MADATREALQTFLSQTYMMISFRPVLKVFVIQARLSRAPGEKSIQIP